MDRQAAAEVGAARRNPHSIAAVRRANQSKQSGVLVDRQQLAFANRPALRRKIEANDQDLADVGIVSLSYEPPAQP